MDSKTYVYETFEALKQKNKHETEFLQAVEEFLPAATLYFQKYPLAMKQNIFAQLLEPERVIEFKVAWLDDHNQVQVNRGYRVQFNSALGPYKGGLRFHPSVSLSILKFLGFEQIFKNSLTSLLIGGGKGGSDFNPKGKSDAEIMRFCQQFMIELHRHIGDQVDIPAGDIGVSAREIGYLYGMYKKLRGTQFGVLTGKPLLYGGSKGRTEATGYGLVYFVQEVLKDLKENMSEQTIHVSGSGNVAIYAIEKAQQLGAKVVTCSDSDGCIYDPDGIDIALLKEIKETNRQRLIMYKDKKPTAIYYEKKSVWELDHSFSIALPCATQNEIHQQQAQRFSKLGVKVVAEGANMPSSLSAISQYQKDGIIYCPGKASNAGGVAVSALEMSQDAQRLMWEKEEVDQKLQKIMQNIYRTCQMTAKAYDQENNILLGANLAALEKVSEAMLSQGVI